MLQVQGLHLCTPTGVFAPSDRMLVDPSTEFCFSHRSHPALLHVKVAIVGSRRVSDLANIVASLVGGIRGPLLIISASCEGIYSM